MSDIVPVYGPTAAIMVEDYIDKVWGNAKNAYATALALLNSLYSLAKVNQVPVTVDWVDITPPQVPNLLPGLPVAPTLDDIPSPPVNFSYSPDPYVSNLLEQLRAKLLSDLIAGGTGLTPEVEADIYARESERDLREHNDAIDRIASRWSEAGFYLPDGILNATLGWSEIEFENRKSDKSRQIAVESLKIAIDQSNKRIDQSISLETILMTYNTEDNKLRLEAAKSILEAGIQIFDALIKEKLAKVELFKAEAEAYKAEVDAVAAIAGVEVAVYNAETQYNIGKATVAEKQIELQIEQLRLQLTVETMISEGIVRVASTLAAGAMSAINAGAHVGFQGSEGVSSQSSTHIGVSTSTSYNHYYHD
jgi:hypothetical protein